MSSGKSALSIVQKYHPEVTRVVDAKKDVSIEVTAGDCRNGKMKSASSCAMARAFEREYDGAIVSLRVAYLIKGDKAIRHLVPPSVSREIVAFDRARKFAPGEYELKAPKGRETLGQIKAHSAKWRRLGNKTTKPSHKTAGIRAL